MVISDLSIRRPVFAMVVNLLVIVAGVLCFTQLPLREYPDIDPPIVSIETVYLGASAEVVESRVTQVLEETISGIAGIKTIESKSEDGVSTIQIEFDLGRDIDAAAGDVRDRISRATRDLPDDVDPPTISKADADTDQIVWIAVQSDQRTGLELTDIVDRFMRDRLSIIDGVSTVIIGGERRYAMRIWLDRQQLAARSLTVDDVEQALRRENVELPAGRIESLNTEKIVRVERAYQNPEDFARMVVRRGQDGYLVRLGDVARVEIGPERERSELTSNRQAAVGLGIGKQSKANTLEVARAVVAEMHNIQESIKHQYPDIKLSLAYDASQFISASIHEVYVTMGLTIVLVTLVIFVFLGDWRATLIPAVTIPVSVMGAFIVLAVMGFSVNLLTLLALVLAIGLVVDDSIVVLENIYKRIENNEPSLAAAQRGANQVAFAVIATTLVLVAVFVPISFMGGEVGKLFTEFSWAIIGAVLFSSLVALTISPMMASKLLKPHAAGHQRNRVTTWLNRALDGFEQRYRAMLIAIIDRPRTVLVVVALLIAAGYGLYRGIPSEYAPTEDRGVIFVVMITPEGSSLEYTKANMRQLEEKMGSLLSPDNGGPANGTGEAHRIVNLVPGAFSATGSVNSGIGIVLLKEWGHRRYAGAIVNELFGKFGEIPGALAFPIMPPSLGQNPQATPVQFVIGGDNYQDLAAWRDLLLTRARANPNLVNIDWDYKEGKPQLKVAVDTDRAAELGVSTLAIGNTLQTTFGSREVTTYLDRGEEYQVVLQNRYQDRLTATDLTNVYVRSDRTGALIPLDNLVSITETADSGTRARFNRVRSITITASLAPGYSLGEALGYLEQAARETLPPQARIDYKGESRDFKETGAAIVFVFLLALVATYLFLAAQFESWVHPAVVMTTVPLALVGALWGLYLTGASLNVYTQVGLIMLVGLAAKNGILIVEFTNQLRDEGMEFIEAILTAAQARLRPILMTSVATVVGALPLAFALVLGGAGAESRFPIGVAIVAGVSISTILTLFIVPVFYALMARHTGSPLVITRELERQLKEGA
jgi:multidrug efflux pump